MLRNWYYVQGAKKYDDERPTQRGLDLPEAARLFQEDPDLKELGFLIESDGLTIQAPLLERRNNTLYMDLDRLSYLPKAKDPDLISNVASPIGGFQEIQNAVQDLRERFPYATEIRSSKRYEILETDALARDVDDFLSSYDMYDYMDIDGSVDEALRLLDDPVNVDVVVQRVDERLDDDPMFDRDGAITGWGARDLRMLRGRLNSYAGRHQEEMKERLLYRNEEVQNEKIIR